MVLEAFLQVRISDQHEIGYGQPPVALAHVARVREVLEQGSIVQQKEFLKGMIADITLYPSKNRGVVRYYDLLPASFKYSGGSR